MSKQNLHIHIHLPGLEALQVTADELNAKLDAVLVNQNESADEVSRIGALIAEIRTQLASGLTPEQTDALGARLDEVVTRTQTVEDSLRSTT